MKTLNGLTIIALYAVNVFCFMDSVPLSITGGAYLIGFAIVLSSHPEPK